VFVDYAVGCETGLKICHLFHGILKCLNPNNYVKNGFKCFTDIDEQCQRSITFSECTYF
jgi:hypothetical protein